MDEEPYNPSSAEPTKPESDVEPMEKRGWAYVKEKVRWLVKLFAYLWSRWKVRVAVKIVWFVITHWPFIQDIAWPFIRDVILSFLIKHPIF